MVATRAEWMAEQWVDCLVDHSVVNSAAELVGNWAVNWAACLVERMVAHLAD